MSRAIAPGPEARPRARSSRHLRIAPWLGVVAVVSGAAWARTLEVPGEYATIGGAMAAAGDGDTVLVHPGTYIESALDFEGKEIVVRGLDPEDPAL